MHALIQFTAFLLFLAVLGLMAGCENKPPRPKTGNLAEQVKTAVATQAGVDTQRLEIESNGGVVRLKGRLDSAEDKIKVQEAAKAVPGVSWVQDQTSVAPQAPVPSAK